ncbi:Phytochrome-like protein cph1 [Botrimarina colliarenosi]|uniref:histidine kinase n=1 Tax=Botrimarina colliarenosi TaxID=2528001 RepID=A0A5C6AKJ1_9BACT|nr:ATP-binding protein [Botrimarina colliarenosi]TWT99966.1 Phytochrome-like protein cph1 [Botrimarina colliarenosi]
MIRSDASESVVDTTNCDREPIHLPGAIQPHGCLLAFSLKARTLTHWSSHADQWLGVAPRGGESLAEFFTPTAVARLTALADDRPGIVHPLGGPILRTGAPRQAADAAAHVWSDALIVELEEGPPDGRGLAPDNLSLPRRLSLANQHFQASSTPDGLYDAIVREVREISGYDRVMLYRFLKGGHGAVVGEAVDPRFGSFLGLHYPATDIPQQARQLYVLNPIRSIADVNAEPVVLRSVNPLSSPPLDLSFSAFRAVSPIHVEYLQNMGVAASMSISLVIDGELWGLIACHHYSPRVLTFDRRAACEMLGTLAGPYLTTRLDSEAGKLQATRRSLLTEVMHDVASRPDFRDGLRDRAPQLRRVLDADGVVFCRRHDSLPFGQTPSETVVRAIEKRLADHPDAVWSTDVLGEEFPDLAEDLSGVAGCLAVATEASDLSAVIFFRGEYAREVRWAGEPTKVETPTAEGGRLSPRHSFAEWRDTVRGQSIEWSASDLVLASEVRLALIELLSRRAANIARLNDELSRINSDLSSFAYAASHDLREPLRGLNQAIFLLRRELHPAPTPQLEDRLVAIEQLAGRMDDLVGGLLRLARAGSSDLQYDHFQLDEVAREAAEMVLGRPIRSDVDLQIQEGVPVSGDFLCVRELLTNLIDNAIKYNRSDRIAVSIGVEEAANHSAGAGRGAMVFVVEDNGIGIAPELQKDVFQIFRRLHLPGEFGGGTGAGLAIAKKVVERHGGRIWIESGSDGGSKLLFTLSPNPTEDEEIE